MHYGVYPIDPDRQDWYVDGDKQNRVARRQFPLSPHFANTVYSSQGLTIGTGVVDLKVGQEHRLDNAVRGNIKVQKGGSPADSAAV